MVLDTKGHIIAEKMLTSRSAINFIICKKEGLYMIQRGRWLLKKMLTSRSTVSGFFSRRPPLPSEYLKSLPLLYLLRSREIQQIRREKYNNFAPKSWYPKKWKNYHLIIWVMMIIMPTLLKTVFEIKVTSLLLKDDPIIFEKV